MKHTKILWLAILFAFLAYACNDDDDETPAPQVNESEVLVKYLESTDSPYGKDYVNTDMPSIISASDVRALNLTDQIYIIDIRDAAAFANGHIENAVNVTLGNLLTHIESVDLSGYEKVAIVCVSGQTAGFATLILRIMGYDNVFSMKWGMCSWHEDFAGPWNSNISNTYATQFTSDVTDKGAMGSLPTISTGKTSGNEILKARVNAVLAEGYDPAKVTGQTVFDNQSNYYIVNYWPADQYADPGHIPGAIQYTPKQTIKYDVDLKTLPTDKPIAVYCYTGQTSSFMAAYLRVLGYDAKSILFGANSMIYDIMVDKDMTVFSDAEIMGYEYVQ